MNAKLLFDKRCHNLGTTELIVRPSFIPESTKPEDVVETQYSHLGSPEKIHKQDRGMTTKQQFQLTSFGL